MQIIFDRIGRCEGCLHFDGHYKTTSACGGCERNPKIKLLKDAYQKPKAIVSELKKNPPVAPPDDPSRLLESANDAELSDMGVLPAAQRRALRTPQEGNGPATP